MPTEHFPLSGIHILLTRTWSVPHDHSHPKPGDKLQLHSWALMSENANVCSNEHLPTSIHSSFVCNSQQPGTTQTAFDRWAAKQIFYKYYFETSENLTIQRPPSWTSQQQPMGIDAQISVYFQHVISSPRNDSPRGQWRCVGLGNSVWLKSSQVTLNDSLL